MAPSTSSFSRCVTCSAKSADSGSASWRRSALASLARWRSSSRRLSSRSRTALASTSGSPRKAASGRSPAAASLLEPLLQLVEWLDELRHAFALKLRRDGVQIDIEPLQSLARIAPFGYVALKTQLRPAQAPIGIECLERDGVDRVGHHQLLDILDRTVAWILGGGWRPQQPLRPRTARRQLLPLRSGDHLLVNFVRATGAGDRRLAAQGARRGLAARREVVQPLVHRGVDAAQEEARDGGEAAERLAGRGARAQAVHVGARNGAITLGREQQRHVHVDARSDEIADYGQPGFRARDLDERVGESQTLPQALRLRQTPGAVVGEVRRHLHAHKAVGAGGVVVERAQERGGVAQILDG